MKRLFKFTSLLLASVLTVGSASAFTASADAMPDPQSRFIIGDVNKDDKVNISDVTEIQRWLANAKELDDAALDAADADQNGEVKIGDATLIQNYCADVYRKDSLCGRAKKDGKVLAVFDYVISDYLNWGNFTAVALDNHGCILPDVKHDYPGISSLDGSHTSYILKLPEDVSSLYIVSEDGQKQTKALTGLNGKTSRTYHIINNNPGGEPEYILRDAETQEVPDNVSFEFKNMLFWNEVYVCGYDEEGKPVGAEWPGEKLTMYNLDEFGTESYQVNTEGASALVINDGTMLNQTEVITNFYPAGGYYYLSSNERYSSGSINYYIPLDADYTPATKEHKLLFGNTQGWKDVYMYVYDESNPNGYAAFPGVKLTDFETNYYGTEVYNVTVPGNADYVIFSDGGKEQTCKIIGFSAYGYYPNKDKKIQQADGRVQYDVLKIYQSECFKVVNTLKWNKVYAYFYNEYGETDVQWPGVELTPVEVNSHGDTVYTSENYYNWGFYGDNAKYLILHSGEGGMQSATIELSKLDKSIICFDPSKTQSDEYMGEQYTPITMNFAE